jgi:hypothetical protein
MLMMKVLANMTHKLSILILPLVAGVLLVNSCTSQQSNVFGEEKQAPDEFAVYSRAPLSMPPDFGLRPPKPGVTRPQTIEPRNTAKEAILSISRTPSSATSDGNAAQAQADQTPGIVALLSNAGATQANPDIRALINSETSGLSNGVDGGIAEKILFWRKNGTVLKGAVIEPAAEQRRMRRTSAEGDVTEEAPATAAPTIQRRDGGASRTKNEKSFWGSLFN